MWPRFLLWHGWLPGLIARPCGSLGLWRQATLHLMILKRLWAPILFALTLLGTCLDQEDTQDVADSVPDHPNIWSDGSREPFLHLDLEVAGAGALAHLPS